MQFIMNDKHTHTHTQEQQPEADHGGVTCDDNVSNIILASIFFYTLQDHLDILTTFSEP